MMPKVYLDDTDDPPTFLQVSLVADAHALREASLEILHLFFFTIALKSSFMLDYKNHSLQVRG